MVNGATRTMKRLLPHPHLGVLLSPGGGNVPGWWPQGTPWALDNGAFSGFNSEAFLKRLEACTPDVDCRFVVAPDAVGDAVKTRMLFAQWAPTIRAKGFPLAYVLQDGQKWEYVPWEECAAIFVGGTTQYKTSREAVALVREAKRKGKWVHMGRVNTLRRFRFAITAGVDSVDGSQFSWFSETYLPQFTEYLIWMCQQQSRLAFD
jgi:hypothetical protein